MATRFETHTHKCPQCGFVWEHDPHKVTEAAFHKSHCCPKCLTEQFWIDDSGEKPSCKNEGFTVVWYLKSTHLSVAVSG